MENLVILRSNIIIGAVCREIHSECEGSAIPISTISYKRAWKQDAYGGRHQPTITWIVENQLPFELVIMHSDTAFLVFVRAHAPEMSLHPWLLSR